MCRPLTSGVLGTGESGPQSDAGTRPGWVPRVAAVERESQTLDLLAGSAGGVSGPSGGIHRRGVAVEIIYSRIAGIDVGKREVAVAVRTPGNIPRWLVFFCVSVTRAARWPGDNDLVIDGPPGSPTRERHQPPRTTFSGSPPPSWMHRRVQQRVVDRSTGSRLVCGVEDADRVGGEGVAFLARWAHDPFT